MLTQSFYPAQDDGGFKRRTIAGELARQVSERGDAYALTEILADGARGRRWTYSALQSETEKLGRALATRHEKGARICVFANNLPEWLLLEYASAFAGLVLVTANPALQPGELRYILEQSKAEGLYYAPLVRGSALGDVVEAATADLAQINTIIDITDHDALFSGHEQGTLRHTEPEDVVQIQYTSGTTGFPKGAMLHQMGLIQNGHDIVVRDGQSAGKRLLHFMPMFHTSGCAIIVLGSLAVGLEILMPPQFDPVMLVDVIEREKPDFLGAVPTMLVALIEQAGDRDLTSVNSILSGGSMVPPDLCRAARRVFGAPVLIIYGQTEASPGITGANLTDSEALATETIGTPYPHMDVAILDPSTYDIMPLDTQGEIAVRGYNVMKGYNDNPEATKKAITEEGWLLTGDLGTMDQAGYLRITGRVKEMIIRGGENLFPAEIENAMLEHPALAEVAVVGVPDDKWGELVACFMRASGTEKPSPQDLKAFIRGKLSPQKTPTYWIWVTDWPLTGSGKIRKFELAEQFVRGEHRAEKA